MVSTSQYLTEFNTPSTTTETGKSPLAMLAKTCETIGLAADGTKKENGSKKSSAESSPDKKNNVVNGSNSSSSSTTDSPPKRKDSPRTSPKTTEPSTSSASTATSFTTMLGHRGFPLGLPMPAFPFPYAGFPMTGIPYPAMPFMPPFARCPSAAVARPCVTPGCTSCAPSPDLLAFNPFMPYSTTGLLPPLPAVSGASSSLSSYQALMAQMSQQMAAAAAGKHTCNWMDGVQICGKTFNSADELNCHMKAVHTSASAPSTPSEGGGKTSSKTSTSLPASVRFNPYSKAGTPALSAFPAGPLAFPGFPALYTQRLMASMPHP